MLRCLILAKLRWPARWVVLCMALALAACAARQANQLAREQLDGGQYEAAMKTLDQAVKAHPDSTELRSTWLRARTEAISRLLTQAAAARSQGKLDDADSLLARAAQLDPDSARVRDLILALDIERRQTAALAQAQGLASKGQPVPALRGIAEALKPNGRHAGLLALQGPHWGQVLLFPEKSKT